MARVFTSGRWVVEPGNEDLFVRAWADPARRGGELPGAGRPTLLRDREHPNVFLSFGAFDDDEAGAAFRGSEIFRDALTKIEPLLDSFLPDTFDEVDR